MRRLPGFILLSLTLMAQEPITRGRLLESDTGRYLFDTVKGADLGQQDGRLVVDFNFAYQPSCAYDPRWTCPLTPPANRLRVPIRAGERVAES